MGDAMLTAGGGCSESLPKTKLEARRLFPLEGTVEPVSQSAVPELLEDLLDAEAPILSLGNSAFSTIRLRALSDDTGFCSIVRTRDQWSVD